jgi:hypothetical protein
MRIWYDASAGKHVRYGIAIAKQLRKSGHEVIFTTREHPDTLALAKALGENPIVVGGYDPASLFTRLEKSADRVLHFSKLFRNNIPEIAIGSQSVELCRVAFGLGIPIILTADTPYAEAVNRLTIPLADTLVVSKAIPTRIFRRYSAKKIVQFNGVDEVAWIQNFVPTQTFGIRRPLIVVRQMESKAAYALGKTDMTEKLARKLGRLGSVLFIARYGDKTVKGLVTAKNFVNTTELVANADLVVGVGGTIGREAALQGIPSIVISARTHGLCGRTYVNEYLAKEGFPLFIVSASKVLAIAGKYLGEKWDVRKKLNKMENPVDVIETIIRKKEFI